MGVSVIYSANSAEEIVKVILNIIEVKGDYSSTTLNEVLIPLRGNDDITQFQIRMVITALVGEWDISHTDLVRIDVRNLYNKGWRLNNPVRVATTKEFLDMNSTLASILFELLRFPSAQQTLGHCLQDWLQYLQRFAPPSYFLSTNSETTADDNKNEKEDTTSHNKRTKTEICHGKIERVGSLKEICRFFIRRNCKFPLYKSVEKLDVPVNLQRYILMGDLLAGQIHLEDILKLQGQLQIDDKNFKMLFSSRV